MSSWPVFISQVLRVELCAQCSFSIQSPREKLTQDQHHLTGEVTEAQGCAPCPGGMLSDGAGSLVVEPPLLTSLLPTLTEAWINLLYESVLRDSNRKTGKGQELDNSKKKYVCL